MRTTKFDPLNDFSNVQQLEVERAKYNARSDAYPKFCTEVLTGMLAPASYDFKANEFNNLRAFQFF